MQAFSPTPRRAVRRGARVAALLALGILAFGAAAEPPTVLRFYGYAYDLKTDAYLYTEVHEQHVAGERWTGGTIRYFGADGAPLGRKTLDFSEDAFVPLYRLELADGYFEAVSAARDRLELERRRGAGKPLQRRAFDKPAPLCADAGLHMFVRSHFPRLMASETLRFRLAVPANLGHFRFRIERAEDTQFEARPAVRFRVVADSLLRFVADPLELVYDAADMKLLEYRGLSNLRDPRSGRAWEVRTAYPRTPPPGVPPLPPLQ